MNAVIKQLLDDGTINQKEYDILFKDKSGWYDALPNNKQDWSDYQNEIKKFYKSLQKIIVLQKNQNEYNLSYLHFPPFNSRDIFIDNIIDKNIAFNNAVFHGEADFMSATFKNEANFMSATFKNEANFMDVTFENEVDFCSATFKDEADFWDTTFEGEAIFLNATFEGDVSFNDATAKKTIHLIFAHIEEFFDASGMSFNLLDIKGTYFESPLLLGLSACENGHKVPLGPKHFANKESARLIKDHFEKQGNITEANKYFRIEQEKHIEALKREETKEHNKLGALITLYLNKYVSNFGIDWFRGLLTLSLFGYVVLFFYMALRYSPFNYPNQFYMAGDWHSSNLSATLFSFIVIAIFYTINLKYVKIQEKLLDLKRYSVVKRYKKIFWLLRITRNIISNIVRYKIILSIVVIICVLSCLSKNDTTNLITQLLNPLNAFKDVDTYKGYETFGAIVRIISATIIYQIIVAFRQNTRRK